MPDILQDIAASLHKGQDKRVRVLVLKALDKGIDAESVLEGGLLAGMEAVGQDFKSGVLFVPEVLVAARAMQTGMEVLRPLLSQGEARERGKCVIGTVQGDIHDIGKNLVKMMLEGAGVEVVDLGIDVNTQAFVRAVREHQPQIVGMSALLTTTMIHMEAVIKALEHAELRDKVKIMIGGTPVTAAFAEEIGADAYAPDAATAVEVAQSLLDQP